MVLNQCNLEKCGYLFVHSEPKNIRITIYIYISIDGTQELRYQDSIFTLKEMSRMTTISVSKLSVDERHSIVNKSELIF